MTRPYVLKQRAAQMEETRRRITEAAVDLHGSMGPARTTIRAIAERAGVERATVYRHFADEAAIFAACSAHWREQHPGPDPSRWDDRDPWKRLRRALVDLYAYYAATRRMWQLTYRDAPHVEALEGPFGEWLAFLDRARDLLAAPFATCGARSNRLRAAIRHALDFRTWDSLKAAGLDDAATVRLMAGMVQAALESDTTRR
jgi:AcrR family transcriptional regulator